MMKPKVNVMERRVRLKTVNSHIICCLCKGYMINATTITECLHTCKLVIHVSCTLYIKYIVTSNLSKAHETRDSLCSF